MADAKTFSLRMSRRADQLRRNVERTVEQAAVVVSKTLIQRTPVDTGLARSNWQIGMNTPQRTPSPIISEREAHERNNFIIQGFAAGLTIYINNMLPYIAKLNRGSSAKAPANFVQQAMIRGIAIIRNARLFQ